MLWNRENLATLLRPKTKTYAHRRIGKKSAIRNLFFTDKSGKLDKLSNVARKLLKF
jgi:hypothetical protein